MSTKANIVLFSVVLLATRLDAQFISPSADVYKPDQPSNQNQQPTYDKPKLVKSIKADLADPYGNSVTITWEPSGIPVEQIIARHNSPISDKTELLKAKAIGRVGAKEFSYLEKNVEPGEHFYAVIPINQIKSKELSLIANDSYTVRPVRVLDPAEIANIVPQVSLIYAKQNNEGTAVRVSWRGVANKNAIYTVYRGNVPLLNAAAIDKSTRLSVIETQQEYFIDNTIPGPGKYYYAVTTRVAQSQEDKNLVANQSYTLEPIEIVADNDPVIGLIKAVSFNQTGAQIFWRDVPGASGANLKYQLYRNNLPINSPQMVRKATMIGQINAGTESYQDLGLSPGGYYYAVLAVNPDGQVVEKLVADKNFTTLPVLVTSTGQGQQITNNTVPGTSNGQQNQPIFTGPSYFADVSGYEQDRLIVLKWRYAKVDEEPPGPRIQIYRFKEPPQDMSDLVKGELLARIRSNRRLYEDVPSERGLYYYALFFETDRGLMPQGFNLDDNLIGPIAILDPQARITRNNNQEKRQPNLGRENGIVTQPNAKNNPAGENRIKPGDLNQNNGQLATNLLNNQPNNISSQKRMTSINDVINQTYSKGAYKAAIQTLQKYLNDKNDSSRAKALFYTGLSYYRLNSFEKALDYFVHPLTVKAYGKRAEFWYRQTLENLP